MKIDFLIVCVCGEPKTYKKSLKNGTTDASGNHEINTNCIQSGKHCFLNLYPVGLGKRDTCRSSAMVLFGNNKETLEFFVFRFSKVFIFSNEVARQGNEEEASGEGSGWCRVT